MAVPAALGPAGGAGGVEHLGQRVAVRRVARGERWWTPHVQHLYQRASRRFGHAKVAIVYGLWTIVAIAVMIATISCEGTRVLAAAAGVPVVAGLAWMGLHRRWGGDKEGFGA